jgi:CubicO group peptidase (beta-lactamase class C family)
MRRLLAGIGILAACTSASPSPSDAGPTDASDAPVGVDVAPSLRARIITHAQGFVGRGVIEVAPAGVTERVPQLPTLTFGVVSDGLQEVFTLARADAPTPTARSVYPISSISKLVTGLIAARGVTAGDFSADAPARTLLAPDLASLVGDRSLLELLTHTAGYHPAEGYTRTQLAACLGSAPCATARAPRGAYLYSNLGVGLAGLALVDRYAMDFESLVTSRLTRELGMVDTHTRARSDDARIVGGLTFAGLPVPPASMGALAPAGELLSTGDDLLLLVRALVRPPAAWEATVRLATAPSAAAPQVGFAIDVLSRRGLDLRAKSGEQAGYSALVMWCPSLRVGAFALTNLGASSKTLAALLIDLHVMLRESL